MKKFTSTALGGAPVNDDDLLDIFNSEIWAAIQGLLSAFDADVQGIVVSGCVTTANAGNFDMTAGVVYLNGEFMRVAAVTNQSFTKYIAPSAAVNDSRTYGDGTTNVTAVTKGAGLVGSAPGSGQYLKIASLTDLDDRRWKPVASVGGKNLKTLTTTIGTWNMDTTATKVVNLDTTDILPIDVSKIRFVEVIIINDSGDIIRRLCDWDSTLADGRTKGGIQNIVQNTSTQIVFNLIRTTGGDFDTSFFTTASNRGWITINYEG